MCGICCGDDVRGDTPGGGRFDSDGEEDKTGAGEQVAARGCESIFAENACAVYCRLLVRLMRVFERVSFWMQYEIQLSSEGVSDVSSFAKAFIGRTTDGTEALATRLDIALSAGVLEYEIFRCFFPARGRVR